jgi:hypothetical protein
MWWRTWLAAGPLMALAAADPTWPSSIDEVEEIMYQLFEFQTRNFADTINPCTNEASGPGRQNAAEWLRVGFHDMSTADFLNGVGGLDASIQYELDSGENLGPGFNTTLKFMSNFFTARSSISDLIALGVYASVRSCGGPVVPFRAGRIDAIGPGRTGVPQPEHHVEVFRSQFQQMGFTPEEMIQVTACGHTIGGVHEAEFPEFLIQGEAPLDSSVAEFDNSIVTEYLANNSTNPLVVGPAVALGKDSDARIFASDGNKTAKALSDPSKFRDVCATVLQKMIDIVPSNVTLTDPVLPYLVKPVDMQLTLNNGGRTMRLSGKIRVRTTDLPKDLLGKLTLQWKDRNGGSQCGSRHCTTTASFRGVSYGFDDSFAFYPIEAQVGAAFGISSFNISIALKNGTTLFFDNNGNEYPLQDAAMIQETNSCLNQYTGEAEVFAAIRNDRSSLPVTMSITYKQSRLGLAVPGLYIKDIPMAKVECVGYYTLYSANWTIPGGVSHSARIDIVSGGGDAAIVDDFNHAVKMPGTCRSFQDLGAPECTTARVSLSGFPTKTATAPSQAPTTWPSSFEMMPPPPTATSLTPMPEPSSTFPATMTPTLAPPMSDPSSTFPATVMPSVLASNRPPTGLHEYHRGGLAAVKGFFSTIIDYVADLLFG